MPSTNESDLEGRRRNFSISQTVFVWRGLILRALRILMRRCGRKDLKNEKSCYNSNQFKRGKYARPSNLTDYGAPHTNLY